MIARAAKSNVWLAVEGTEIEKMLKDLIIKIVFVRKTYLVVYTYKDWFMFVW